jgi:hypothetical protein
MTASMTYVLALRKLLAASAFQTFSRKIAGVLPAGSVGVKKTLYHDETDGKARPKKNQTRQVVVVYSAEMTIRSGSTQTQME